MKYIKLFVLNFIVFSLFCLFPILMLCSCGHNVVTVSKGVGINFSWDGSNYVPNLKLGQWDQITYVVRGNSSAATTTVTGGNLGTGGIAQTIAFNSGIQLNQKNIVQICNDPNSSDEVKAQLVKAILTIRSPNIPISASKTVAAVSGINTQAKNLNPVVTGTDKIVNEVSKNASKTINATQNVSKTTVKSVKDYFKQATEIISNKILIFSIVCVILIIGVIVLIYYIKKRKTKE